MFCGSHVLDAWTMFCGSRNNLNGNFLSLWYYIYMIGTLRKDLEAEDVYPAQEGECNLFYGVIGSGKTYGAS